MNRDADRKNFPKSLVSYVMAGHPWQLPKRTHPQCDCAWHTLSLTLHVSAIDPPESVLPILPAHHQQAQPPVVLDNRKQTLLHPPSLLIPIPIPRYSIPHLMILNDNIHLTLKPLRHLQLHITHLDQRATICRMVPMMVVVWQIH